jgi:hypothetical protein
LKHKGAVDGVKILTKTTDVSRAALITSNENIISWKKIGFVFITQPFWRATKKQNVEKANIFSPRTVAN